MCEIRQVPKVYPAIYPLSIFEDWIVIVGGAQVVAVGRHKFDMVVEAGSYKACTKFKINWRMPIRLFNNKAGTYFYTDWKENKLLQEKIEVKTDFIGRYFPHLGLIILKDRDTNKPIDPETMSEIIAGLEEGEKVEEVVVETHGIVAVNANNRFDTVYNILKQSKHIYFGGYLTKEKVIESRTHVADVEAGGDVESYCTSETTKIISMAGCIVFPRLKLKKIDDTEASALSEFFIQYTDYCPYRGGDCEYVIEFYRFKLTAKKTGEISGELKKISEEEYNVKDIVKEAI